jgi:hypothetical protein
LKWFRQDSPLTPTPSRHPPPQDRQPPPQDNQLPPQATPGSASSPSAYTVPPPDPYLLRLQPR